MNDVTQLLDRSQASDPDAAGELLPLVYEELRKLAAARMAKVGEDVGIVAEKIIGNIGKKSFKMWFAHLKNSSDGTKGIRYELEVAAHFARQAGTELHYIRKLVFKPETGKIATDMDVLVKKGGEWFMHECKHSAAALRGGETATKAANKAEAIVTELRAIGVIPPPIKIVYTSPQGVTFPPKYAHSGLGHTPGSLTKAVEESTDGAALIFTVNLP